MGFLKNVVGPAGSIKAEFSFSEPLICHIELAYNVPDQLRAFVSELQALWHIPLHIAQGLYSVANNSWFTEIYGGKTKSREIVRDRIIENLFSLSEKVTIISSDPPVLDLTPSFPDIRQIVSSNRFRIPSATVTSRMEIWRHSKPSVLMDIPTILADYYFFASALSYIAWGFLITRWNKDVLNSLDTILFAIDDFYRDQVLSGEPLTLSAPVVEHVHKTLKHLAQGANPQ